MITPRVMTENIQAAVDAMHIDGEAPIYTGHTPTKTHVMELRPLESVEGFSIILSDGSVFQAVISQVR